VEGFIGGAEGVEGVVVVVVVVFDVILLGIIVNRREASWERGRRDIYAPR